MNKKKYWKGIEEIAQDPTYINYANKEFANYLPTNASNGKKITQSSTTSRRDFLKMMGFSIAAVSLAACEAPVRKAIPYLNKPVDIDPGIPNYYASTYMQQGDYCGIVVKTREGRPIKITGNTLCPITQGGIHAQVEASVLSLYDHARLQSPQYKGSTIDWEALDQNVIQKLTAIAKNKGQICIISNTIISPSTKATIKIFQQQYPTTQHIMYDTRSSYGIIKANEQAFHLPIIPTYDFSKAKVIVSFAADFLGTWLTPIAFTKQYSKARKLSKKKKDMVRHYQLEANLSLTGANADYRIPLKPSLEGKVLVALYHLLIKKSGKKYPLSITQEVCTSIEHLEDIAADLWQAQGKSLVVASSNDPTIQLLTNAINHLLNNYGTTISLDCPSLTRQGNDQKMQKFVQDLQKNKIDAVIFLNANPVYDHPMGNAIAQALPNVQLSIATNDRLDETASLVDYVAPDHHYLEAWNDANPQAGHYSLAQPTITPIFKTRQAPESFLIWGKHTIQHYYTFLQQQWRNNFFDKQLQQLDFQTFWDQSLFNGVYKVPISKQKKIPAFQANLTNCIQAIIDQPSSSSTLELVLYEKIGIGNGAQANNPWLQEMPDPVTKACWDNYITMSQSMASQYGIHMREGKTSLVHLTVNSHKLKLPVLVQPGQATNTVGLALGFGRTKAGRVADQVGVNAYPLIPTTTQGIDYVLLNNVHLTLLKESYSIAQTQTHETYMGRDFVIQEATLSAYQKNPSAGRHIPKISTSQGKKKPSSITLWEGHATPNHHWGMVIDMNACTGCSACTIACQAENNVPVVGREEVLNRREMHWIRIDRYYSSDASLEDYKGLEKASANPEVTFQPMMCQHCNNAPCETVCPVVATTHSAEGLNQMTYNRCIGTRYCANNCPYKVRRFNWFKYHDNQQFSVNTSMSNTLGKMVLNPDVTVRARGVMEKCSLCVQRIQAGKLQAKLAQRPVQDGDIQTACAAACPANAIVFGDMNDTKSQISEILSEEKIGRAYHVLEEVNTQPNVTYLTKIRNKNDKIVL